MCFTLSNSRITGRIYEALVGLYVMLYYRQVAPTELKIMLYYKCMIIRKSLVIKQFD